MCKRRCIKKTFMDTNISRLKLCYIAAPLHEHLGRICFMSFNYFNCNFL